MGTLSISPDDYEIMLRKMVKGIFEEENILLSLQRRPSCYGVDFSDFNDVDKLYVERVKFYFSSLYPYSKEIILSSTKSISEECFFWSRA